MKKERKELTLCRVQFFIDNHKRTNSYLAMRLSVDPKTISKLRRELGLRSADRRSKRGRPSECRTLCDTCSRATAVTCPFMDKKPSAGLTEIGAMAEVKMSPSVHGDKKIPLYFINKCPHYKKGPLPPIKWAGSVV